MEYPYLIIQRSMLFFNRLDILLMKINLPYFLCDLVSQILNSDISSLSLITNRLKIFLPILSLELELLDFLLFDIDDVLEFSDPWFSLIHLYFEFTDYSFKLFFHLQSLLKSLLELFFSFMWIYQCLMNLISFRLKSRINIFELLLFWL